MNKFHLTEKEIRNNYMVQNIYSVGYCELERTLNIVTSPFAYTATNLYGWKADFYSLDGAIISTGYAPMGGISIEHKLCQKCEAKTAKIIDDFNHGKIKKWSTVQARCKKALCATMKKALSKEGK